MYPKCTLGRYHRQTQPTQDKWSLVWRTLHPAFSFHPYFLHFCILLPPLPVKCPVHVMEVLVGNVRVDLGGGDVSVTQQGLHGAEIGAI